MNDDTQKRRIEASRIAEIRAVLKEFGEDFDLSTWEVHNKLVIYHVALERIAAKAGITFDMPDVVRAEAKEAVICVKGSMGAKSEWSFGEAAIDVNYKVTGGQKPFVYAMAEKRAKDRVILKLINLHGEIYSEEEAEDLRQKFDSDAAANKIMDRIDACQTAAEVEALMKSADIKSLIERMTKEHGEQVTNFGRQAYKLRFEGEKLRAQSGQRTPAGTTQRQPAAMSPPPPPPPPTQAKLPENASDRRDNNSGFGFGGDTSRTVDETLAAFRDELRYCHTREEVQATCDTYKATIESFTQPDMKLANDIRKARLDEIAKADAAERMRG
jgi:hypothetical protein